SIDVKNLSYGNTRIVGIDFSKQQKAKHSLVSGEITEGREIRSGENGVVVIGENLKKDFGKFLNQTIVVNNKRLLIVGIYSSSSPLLGSTAVVSIADAREMIGFPNDKVSQFALELDNPAVVKPVVDAINFRFKGELKAFSSSDLSSQFGGILGSFRLLVVAVAAISAIVAGVGIINTMLMSVLERFKEIGTLKAVGWTNSNVIQMILMESVMVSFFGAIFGIIAGYLFGAFVHAVFGLTTLITFELLFEVFVFAFVLGVIGGAYPSFVASKMDPVEALRSE
ncbi:MAG: FtsX-like permease family protein, partial [archaeon]